MYIHIDFTRKADTPDARSVEQASGVEQALIASNPYQTNGVGFQGFPGDEPYLIGNENDGVQGIGSNRPAFSDPSGMPGVEADDFGIESAMVGINPGDAMRGLDSDGRPFFNDGVHPDDTGGHDSMAGIVPIPSISPLPAIAGNGQAQATDAGWSDDFDNASYGPFNATDE